MEDSYKIFLSYSRQDKNQVFAIKSEIESFIRKDICWIDLRGIESDQQFADVIIKAINETIVFLFFYSVNSKDSKYARKELEYASRKDKKIVFVKLDKTPLSDWYEFHFGGHDIIDIDDIYTKQKLLINLCEWCGERNTQSVSTTGSLNNGYSFNNSFLFAKKVRLLLILIIVIIMLAIVFLVRKPQSYKGDPDDLINLADSLCSAYKQYPLEVVSNVDNPQIFDLYMKGAEGCDEKANQAIQYFNTCEDYDFISNAQYYSHDAGYAWARIGEYEKSISSYKKAITYGKMIALTFEIDDDVRDNIRNISYGMNNLAFSYFDNGDTTLALNTIDEAILYNSTSLDYRDSKGELLYLCGKYEEALEQ